MGAIVSLPVTFLGSCLGTLASQTICTLLWMGHVKSLRVSRCLHLGLFITHVALIWICARAATPSWLGPLLSRTTVDSSDTQSFRYDLALRAAMASTTVWIILALLCCCGNWLSKFAARSYFVLKFILVPILFISYLFIPAVIVSKFYAMCVMFTSMVFIAIQIVLFIDMGYSWNEVWVENAETQQATGEGNGRKWYIGIIVAALLLYAGAFTCSTLLFKNVDDKLFHNFDIGSVIVTILLTGVSLTEWCGHGALLPSAVVGAYSSFLSWASVSSKDKFGESINLGIIIVSFALMFLSLMHHALATWTPDIFHVHATVGHFDDTTGDALLSGSDTDDGEDSGEDLGGDLPNDINSFVSGSSALEGHALEVTARTGRTRTHRRSRFVKKEARTTLLGYFSILAFASLYAVGILTNWHTWEKVSFWAFSACQWGLVALYCWTLIAPQLFPDRDFGVN